MLLFENELNYKHKKILKKNKLIEENFFIINSNNLQNVYPHMYGFSVSKKGILTNNYYKKIGKYKEPEPQGIYVMIRKNDFEINITQDCQGSFGLYIYENKEKNYFALSNSFLLLEEYLIGRQAFSFNKDFADNFVLSEFCSYSIHETIVKEIVQIPSNGFIRINILTKKLKIYYKDYMENSIPLESEEGLRIIDKWMDKWGYIFRSLKKKSDNIVYDLSGGFDTRTLLTILLNSGINPDEIFINSSKDKKRRRCHVEDLKIANNISLKFGFKLNNYNLDRNAVKWGKMNTLFCSIYSKLGFHKDFILNDKFFNKPRFSFTGMGGEYLRGAPEYPIEKYIEKISSNDIFDQAEEFYNSSIKFLKRNVAILKNEKEFNNDYEITYSLYSKALGTNHFGKTSLEGFMANIYKLNPLMDPYIKQIRYDINGDSSHDLIAYIYIRFAPDLIRFPFEGNRILNIKSIEKAKILNKKLKPYKIKSNFNPNFYIDVKRTIQIAPLKEKENVYNNLKKLFDDFQFLKSIKKIYDDNVCNWAKEKIKKSNFHPLRHEYGFLAIAITIENLLINKKYLNKSSNQYKFKEKNKIIHHLIK